MNRFGQRNGMDWFFDRVFPKLFIGIFAVALTAILVQFAIVGFIGYKVITDPMGSANFIGTVAGEALKPVANAVNGE
jgi:hypothetical protein